MGQMLRIGSHHLDSLVHDLHGCRLDAATGETCLNHPDHSQTSLTANATYATRKIRRGRAAPAQRVER
jgi:hypothetical protein